MPVDRGAIDAQLREIGEGERWWEQREFRALPHVLHADERILGLANGRLLGARRPWPRPVGGWLLVATDQRLICLRQERFARKQVEFAAGQVARLHQSSRLRAYQITIETAQGRYRIRIPKADAFRFAGALAPLMPNARLQGLAPDLNPWPWLPGGGAIATLPGVSDLMALLSPPDTGSSDRLDRLDASVERLQNDVERLQQQVAFLEELLQERSRMAAFPGSSAES